MNDDQNKETQWYYDYKKHQESILYNRINFSSLAIAIFTTVAESLGENIQRQKFIASLGITLTLLWSVTVLRQYYLLEFIRKQLHKHEKDKDKGIYGKYREGRKNTFGEKWLPRGQTTLVWIVPIVFLYYWLGMLYRPLYEWTADCPHAPFGIIIIVLAAMVVWERRKAKKKNDK